MTNHNPVAVATDILRTIQAKWPSLDFLMTSHSANLRGVKGPSEAHVRLTYNDRGATPIIEFTIHHNLAYHMKRLTESELSVGIQLLVVKYIEDLEQ